MLDFVGAVQFLYVRLNLLQAHRITDRTSQCPSFIEYCYHASGHPVCCEWSQCKPLPRVTFSAIELALDHWYESNVCCLPPILVSLLWNSQFIFFVAYNFVFQYKLDHSFPFSPQPTLVPHLRSFTSEFFYHTAKHSLLRLRQRFRRSSRLYMGIWGRWRR